MLGFFSEKYWFLRNENLLQKFLDFLPVKMKPHYRKMFGIFFGKNISFSELKLRYKNARDFFPEKLSISPKWNLVKKNARNFFPQKASISVKSNTVPINARNFFWKKYWFLRNETPLQKWLNFLRIKASISPKWNPVIKKFGIFSYKSINFSEMKPHYKKCSDFFFTKMHWFLPNKTSLRKMLILFFPKKHRSLQNETSLKKTYLIPGRRMQTRCSTCPAQRPCTSSWPDRREGRRRS